MIKKIKNYFKKWKLVDTTKYAVEPIVPKTYKFVLTEKQQAQVDELYDSKGSMDYIFYFTGIGTGFKVKLWKTNEYIDLTDYDTW